MQRSFEISETPLLDFGAMTPSRNWTVIWPIMALLWTAVLLFFTLTPAPPHIAGPFGWDKLQHAVALGVLAYLVARTCTTRHKTLLISSVIGCVSATLLGGLIELLQECCTANRDADILDFGADVIGAFIAILFLLFSVKYRGAH